MDKTGTLTLGRPVLVAQRALDGYTDDQLLQMAAAAEDHSAHPLAAAIVNRAREVGLAWAAAEEVQAIPGRGLAAKVAGCPILLGNLDLMEEWSVEIAKSAGPESSIGQGEAPAAEPAPGITRLWMAVDPADTGKFRIAGWFDARDTLRPSARPAVEWLKSAGLSVEILTGDSLQAAQPVADQLGIPQLSAALMPAGKVDRIRALQAEGRRVAMVGDGINDAAALAQADAGMAMGSGAALAQEAGDVLLLSNDPTAIATAIALSRATLRVMRQNLGWAVGYNAIGIPLAAGLLYPWLHLALTPWMAAAAMAFSSVSVLLNSLRLRSWKAPLTPR